MTQNKPNGRSGEPTADAIAVGTGEQKAPPQQTPNSLGSEVFRVGLHRPIVTVDEWQDRYEVKIELGHGVQLKRGTDISEVALLNSESGSVIKYEKVSLVSFETPGYSTIFCIDLPKSTGSIAIQGEDKTSDGIASDDVDSYRIDEGESGWSNDFN